MTERLPRARVSRQKFALVFGALALASACRRKAPGPDECRDYALAATGVHRELDLRMPGVLERVNDLTTKCLVTPYDRELVTCVQQGLGARACMSEFAARHPDLDATPVPSRARRRELPIP
jgi:hypothetical protein